MSYSLNPFKGLVKGLWFFFFYGLTSLMSIYRVIGREYYRACEAGYQECRLWLIFSSFGLVVVLI